MSVSSNFFRDLAMPGVQGLQPYQPGKPIEELEREYGITDIIKLASNENPLGPSPRALETARTVLGDAHLYPDGNGFELRHALAHHHAVDASQVTLGNGSNDVIDLIARVFLGAGRDAVMSEHAFAVYPISTLAVGARPVVVPPNPREHGQPYGHDLAAMARAVTKDTRVVFVANPNNPTGTWCAADEMEAFLRAIPSDVLVVLDEAYVEYAVDAAGYVDGSRWLASFPNLILTRTFSKAYGLAGLRVGYALSHPEVADLLNRVRQPFNVSLPAQAAALAALADTDHLTRSVELNRRERELLQQGLRALGVACLPSAGNFVCAEVGPRAPEVYEGLLRQGVIVRPVGGYRLPNYLRFSIGLPEENQRLLSALGELAGHDLLQGR